MTRTVRSPRTILQNSRTAAFAVVIITLQAQAVFAAVAGWHNAGTAADPVSGMVTTRISFENVISTTALDHWANASADKDRHDSSCIGAK